MIIKIFNFILVFSNFGAAFSAAVTLMNARLIRIKDTGFKHHILAAHAFLWMLFAFFLLLIVGYSNFCDYLFLRKKDVFGSNAFVPWIACSPIILTLFFLEHFMKIFHKKNIPANIKVKKMSFDFCSKYPPLPQKGFYSLFSKWNHFYNLELMEYEIRLDKLASEFDGLKIIFLSDIHFGKYDKRFLDEVINISNREQPDLVFFGGDLISKEKYIYQAGEIIKSLQAKLGKYAVLGNHDYWTNHKKVIDSLERAGFKVLSNEFVDISIGAQKLIIFGIDSPRSLMKKAKEILKTHADKDPEIIITHNPDHIASLPIEPLSLILSGHTHGGQIQFPIIGPIMLPSSFNRKFSQGIYRRKGNILIIGKGIGGDPPFRFRCKPEIIKIILRSGTKNKQTGKSKLV